MGRKNSKARINAGSSVQSGDWKTSNRARIFPGFGFIFTTPSGKYRDSKRRRASDAHILQTSAQVKCVRRFLLKKRSFASLPSWTRLICNTFQELDRKVDGPQAFLARAVFQLLWLASRAYHMLWRRKKPSREEKGWNKTNIVDSKIVPLSLPYMKYLYDTMEVCVHSPCSMESYEIY